MGCPTGWIRGRILWILPHFVIAIGFQPCVPALCLATETPGLDYNRFCASRTRYASIIVRALPSFHSLRVPLRQFALYTSGQQALLALNMAYYGRGRGKGRGSWWYRHSGGPRHVHVFGRGRGKGYPHHAASPHHHTIAFGSPLTQPNPTLGVYSHLPPHHATLALPGFTGVPSASPAPQPAVHPARSDPTMLCLSDHLVFGTTAKSRVTGVESYWLAPTEAHKNGHAAP